MSSITITVQDKGVRDGLQALKERVGNIDPLLQGIGDDIVERARRRFETSTGPDGAAWKPLSATTLGLISERIGSKKSNVKKDGSLNARGTRALANRKPLVDTGSLRRQIVAQAAGGMLTVNANQAYAAIHQFGGKAGRGKKVTIPARPFMPVMLGGDLYPTEASMILNALNEYLSEGL